MRWIYICGNRLLNMSACGLSPEMMRSPAASNGATEAPTCIQLYKGKINITVQGDDAYDLWIQIDNQMDRYVEMDCRRSLRRASQAAERCGAPQRQTALRKRRRACHCTQKRCMFMYGYR